MFQGKPHAEGFIMMLHRVADWNVSGIVWNENMKVTPSKLDELLSIYEKKYDFIRLEDVPERLKSQNRRKFMVFTMDDGYKDNFTEALPIFKKHNAPYTIFLASDFMDKRAILWWYAVERLLLENDSVTLSSGITYPCHTNEEMCNSFLKIREVILKIDQLHLLEGLNELFSCYNIDWFKDVEDLALSWNDIEQLKNEPLVTLGAHTQHHYNLKALPSIDDIKDEVMNGYHRLEDKADIHPVVFAYPFGSINEAGEREFNILQHIDERIHLAVRACGGPITENIGNQYALPRIMMENSFHALSLLRCKDVFVL